MTTRRELLLAAATCAGSAMAGTRGELATRPERDRDAREEYGDTYDVVVCGGGPAGVTAAVMAARSGAKVLLVERYGRLGGMAVQALVGPLMGRARSPMVEEILRRIGGREPDVNRLDLEYADMLHEARGDLLLHAWAAEPIVRGQRVQGVRLLTKDGFQAIEADVVIDATGDGDVAARAGAAFEKGRPGDGLLQPVSIMYRVGGVDPDALLCGSEEEAMGARTPDGSWHDVVQEAIQTRELAPEIGVVRLYRSHRPGEIIVNATQVNRIDGTNPGDLTRAEILARKQAWQVLEFLRRHGPGYERAYMAAMPATVGVRETRRILGVEYLTREDLLEGREWPEAVVREADFVIDIHNPAGAGQADGFAQRVKPYDIPYGCLVPRDTDGLLVAGRCISGSHDAHASYRVQCIAMAIGAAAGAAASLASRDRVEPREVDPERIQRVLW